MAIYCLLCNHCIQLSRSHNTKHYAHNIIVFWRNIHLTLTGMVYIVGCYTSRRQKNVFIILVVCFILRYLVGKAEYIHCDQLILKHIIMVIYDFDFYKIGMDILSTAFIFRQWYVVFSWVVPCTKLINNNTQMFATGIYVLRALMLCVLMHLPLK